MTSHSQPAASNDPQDELRDVRHRLRHASRLASLGQLTTGIAHEIRNPLNFVTNFTEASQDSVAELRSLLSSHRHALPAEVPLAVDELLDTLDEDLATILRHAERVANIVEQMLAHARGEQGPPKLLDLNALVQESAQLAYHGSRAADPSLRVNLDYQLDPTAAQVQGIPQNLSRALINLISNGFAAVTERRYQCGDDYHPSLTVTTQREAQGLVISIRDNGIGMSDSIRSRLGEPFFTTRATAGGTGLGFALAQEIIQQHRGSLRVDSQPGAYTDVQIHLPHPDTEH